MKIICAVMVLFGLVLRGAAAQESWSALKLHIERHENHLSPSHLDSALFVERIQFELRFIQWAIGELPNLQDNELLITYERFSLHFAILKFDVLPALRLLNPATDESRKLVAEIDALTAPSEADVLRWFQRQRRSSVGGGDGGIIGGTASATPINFMPKYEGGIWGTTYWLNESTIEATADRWSITSAGGEEFALDKSWFATVDGAEVDEAWVKQYIGASAGFSDLTSLFADVQGVVSLPADRSAEVAKMFPEESEAVLAASTAWLESGLFNGDEAKEAATQQIEDFASIVVDAKTESIGEQLDSSTTEKLFSDPWMKGLEFNVETTRGATLQGITFRDKTDEGDLVFEVPSEIGTLMVLPPADVKSVDVAKTGDHAVPR